MTARAQGGALCAALTAAAALAAAAAGHGAEKPWLLAIGLGIGAALYHASFGFAGAWRRAAVEGDLSGVAAQAAMIALAAVLFAPVLASGEARGALAPVAVSAAVGAFLFGVGMQIGGGCASGTLYAVGGGSARMAATLAAFCAGAFVGSLHLPWWRTLPEAAPVSLGATFGWPAAVAVQLALLGLAVGGLRLAGARTRRPLWGRMDAGALWRGPWPLLLGAAALAVLNWLVLLVSGHAWSIVWGFTLWAAKAAAWLGWDPATSAFWAGRAALERPLLADDTSVTNFGILLGAFAAAAAAGRLRAGLRGSGAGAGGVAGRRAADGIRGASGLWLQYRRAVFRHRLGQPAWLGVAAGGGSRKLAGHPPAPVIRPRQRARFGGLTESRVSC